MLCYEAAHYIQSEIGCSAGQLQRRVGTSRQAPTGTNTRALATLLGTDWHA